jgi:general secretion pathway protein A
LRILSNLAGGGRPQIQIVLSGQPELDAILQGATQRALRQRIAVRARIRPLTRRQVAAYLQFKLSRAGAAPNAVLSRAAIRRIAAASAGFPRRVNIIADNALMAGFGADSKPVHGRMVSRALTALNDRPRRRGWMFAAPFALPAALALAVIAWSAIPSPFGSGADSADRALASPSALPAQPAFSLTATPMVEAEPPTAPAQPAAVPELPVPVAVASLPPDVALPQVIEQPQAIPPQVTAGAPLTAPAVAQPRLITHRVKPGDTLTMILRDHAMPADPTMLARLRGINPELTNVDRVFVGQDILLPVTTP